MSLRMLQVDAFADGPFTGNPAAVVFLDEMREDALLQKIAAENNLSETAFVLPEGEAWRLRWFTPRAEVDLCGHATLATAHALWEEERLAPGAAARFLTRSGELQARQSGDEIVMDFPARLEDPAPAPAGLAAALGAEPSYVGRNVDDYLVLLDDEALLRRLEPDFRALRQQPVRGVIVTAKATTSEWDFVSRFFAPRVGVDEDPVTGSAHCCLAPFWAKRLGCAELRGYQASARGGVVGVRVAGDRVSLAGRAVSVFSGELRV